jgi:aminoglycoside phosphotransferase (APT) family kinase protein
MESQPVAICSLALLYEVAGKPQFLPLGNSAYSYRVEAVTGEPYYLKVVDRRTGRARQTAEQMRTFSLPLQRFVAQLELEELGAPLPQRIGEGLLAQESGRLLLALYTFIEGETLGDAYPMSAELVGRIGWALGELHAVQFPESLRHKTMEDAHLAAFDEQLRVDLEIISSISARASIWKQQLRKLVVPRLEMIRGFIARAEQYAEQVQRLPKPLVVCHGDPWGGNMIPTGDGRLIFLDWESAVVAPAERDAFFYLSDPSQPEFWAFLQGYEQTRGEPIQWQPMRLAYHAYRHQLRNLAHWVHTLLHEQLDEEQRANDLEMIGFHCLDRWEGIEQATTRLLAASL